IRNEPTMAGDVTAVLPTRRHDPAGPAAAPLMPGGQGSRGNRGGLAGQSERGGPPGRGSGAGRPAAPGAASRRSRDLPATPYGDTRDADGGIAALARLGGPSADRSRPPVADDDPLTSPSFPAIRDEDSRSYRSRRPEAPSAGRRPAGSHPSGSYPSERQGPASQVPNGHVPNGHVPNGHVPNGHVPNGHVPNGHVP